MNISAITYVALRALYIVLYVKITSRKLSYLRSINWAISVGLLMRLFWKAGNVLAKQG